MNAGPGSRKFARIPEGRTPDPETGHLGIPDGIFARFRPEPGAAGVRQPFPSRRSSRLSEDVAEGTVSLIDALVRQRGITQTEAARLLALSQPDITRLLRGDFREYSLERLFRLLTALGRDIDIVIRQPRSATGGRLRIAPAETG